MQVQFESEPVDWLMIKAEEEAIKKAREHSSLKEEKRILDSLIFGLGQPIQTYRDNGDFTQSRFKGWSSSFLFWLRLLLLIFHAGWTVTSYYSNGGWWMCWFVYWTNWGWWLAIISTLLSMLAAHNPEYWHVTAHAWTDIAQQMNVFVLIGFWGLIIPYGLVTGGLSFLSGEDAAAFF